MRVLSLTAIFAILLALVPARASSLAATDTLTICRAQQPGSFPVATKDSATPFVCAPEDAPVVQIALNAVAGDVQGITGQKPAVVATNDKLPPVCVIAGTLGKSGWIDRLAASGTIPVAQVRGKWETFLVTTVDKPFPGVDRALVIAGSDRRGTAYGIFELSRIMGVSPWIWWADVAPEKREDLAITPGTFVSSPPAVKYRGIFLNDEDWSLQPWAAAQMDPDIHDIGPKTYAHIFELMLRLRADIIWPAMHPCTKAFYHYPDNPKTADAYAIVVGSSHAEPMLRDNVYDWKNFEDEFHEKPGEYRYDTNETQVDAYWRARVQQSANYESMYTLGMRGIHDSAMLGPKSPSEKVTLLDKVITNQRAMLTDVLQKPVESIPQVFCPYKEVLGLYRAGLQVPDDVTLMWVDDNHGYIRQLSNPQERKRPGGAGVYYHFSYYGAPADYLWLCSTPLDLVSSEMHRAFATGADRVWIYNVGGLKKSVIDLEYGLDLAWAPAHWTPQNTHEYLRAWAARTFGDAYADEIAGIEDEYFALAQYGKPEHVLLNTYSKDEAQDRLKRYAALGQRVEALEAKIPARLQDAYFEIIAYPAEGTWKMNEKVLGAKLGRADEAAQAYADIQSLTDKYNKDIAGGKWAGMVDSRPRKQRAFDAPATFVGKDGGPALSESSVSQSVDLSKPSARSDDPHHDVVDFPHLGHPSAIGRATDSLAEFPVLDQAPWVEYTIPLTAGAHTLRIRFLPTHPLYDGAQLRAGLSVNGGETSWFNLEAEEFKPDWATNVLRGFTETTLDHVSTGPEKITLRVSLPDPGAIITSIDVVNPVAPAP